MMRHGSYITDANNSKQHRSTDMTTPTTGAAAQKGCRGSHSSADTSVRSTDPAVVWHPAQRTGPEVSGGSASDPSPAGTGGAKSSTAKTPALVVIDGAADVAIANVSPVDANVSPGTTDATMKETESATAPCTLQLQAQLHTMVDAVTPTAGPAPTTARGVSVDPLPPMLPAPLAYPHKDAFFVPINPPPRPLVFAKGDTAGGDGSSLPLGYNISAGVFRGHPAVRLFNVHALTSPHSTADDAAWGFLRQHGHLPAFATDAMEHFGIVAACKRVVALPPFPRELTWFLPFNVVLPSAATDNMSMAAADDEFDGLGGGRRDGFGTVPPPNLVDNRRVVTVSNVPFGYSAQHVYFVVGALTGYPVVCVDKYVGPLLKKNEGPLASDAWRVLFPDTAMARDAASRLSGCALLSPRHGAFIAQADSAESVKAWAVNEGLYAMVIERTTPPAGGAAKKARHQPAAAQKKGPSPS